MRGSGEGQVGDQEGHGEADSAELAEADQVPGRGAGRSPQSQTTCQDQHGHDPQGLAQGQSQSGAPKDPISQQSGSQLIQGDGQREEGEKGQDHQGAQRGQEVVQPFSR